MGVDAKLLGSWVALVDDITVLAGQRLSFILKDILKHRKHRDAESLGRGLLLHHARRNRWHHNLMLNLSIAVVVEPILILFFCWHGQWRVGSLQRKATV